jgi:hypothetical protein
MNRQMSGRNIREKKERERATKDVGEASEEGHR